MEYKKESLRKRRGFAFPPPNLAFPASTAESPSPRCTSSHLKSQLHFVLQRERRPGTSPPRAASVKPSWEQKLRGALEERSARRAELFPLPDGAEPAAPPLRPAGKGPAAAPGWGLGVSHPPPEELSKKACCLLPGLSREGEKHTPESHPL